MAVNILMWVGLAFSLCIIFIIQMIGLIIISKKTHAIVEIKSSFKGQPISIFFQDNRYCEFKNNKTEAGLIDDKEYGTFVIDSTYIDSKTKNVYIVFNSGYAISLNAKAAKLADDLTYIFKEQSYKTKLKKSLQNGIIEETYGINTLRTSINFSAIKDFVSPILPHNIKSYIVTKVESRLNGVANNNIQNVILLIISALGAIILGGLVLKFMVLK